MSRATPAAVAARAASRRRLAPDPSPEEEASIMEEAAAAAGADDPPLPVKDPRGPRPREVQPRKCGRCGRRGHRAPQCPGLGAVELPPAEEHELLRWLAYMDGVLLGVDALLATGRVNEARQLLAELR